ncbi:MAG: hypothetical protein ACI310_02090 [Bacilli bacterium]
MDNLLEELIVYEDLIRVRENLNKELSSLSGKTSQDSIARINEIGHELNEVSSKISSYDKDKLDKINKYFATDKEFRRISGELQTIEKLSKDNKEEKIEVKSAEGRPKRIYKSLVEEYKQLVEQKNSMRKEFYNEYKDIENITTTVNTSVQINEETKTDTQNNEYVLPTFKGYEDLTDEEKLKYLEERLQRIFDSVKLPNMGKKSQVIYNGIRYNIPKAYVGRFNETIRALNTIKNKMASKEVPEEPKKEDIVITVKTENKERELTPKEKFEAKLEEIYGKDTIVLPKKEENKVTSEPKLEEENPYIFGHYQPQSVAQTKSTSNGPTLPDLMDQCKKNKIELHPVPTTFRRKHKVNLKKAFACVKKKISLENFKKLLPKVWNIDKYTERAFAQMNNKLYDKKIVIKGKIVNFAEETIQKYNSAKTFVTSIPKRTKDYISGKYKEFTKFLKDKKEIATKRKEEGYTTKTAMEEVYGDKADKHLDYRIVNRTTRFKEDTCQRINSATGKIVDTTKSIADKITKPFRYLRDNMKNDIKRQELQRQIDEIRASSKAKSEALKRIRINNSSGYVGTVAITIVGVIVLAGIIFMGIGSIINR